MTNVVRAWASVVGDVSVEPLDYAYGDNAWVVSASDGSEYILKRFHTIAVGEPLLRLACEHRVLTHLRSYGVPVAVPLVTDDAQLYASEGSDVYVLSPRLAGSQEDPESRPDAIEVYARIGAAFGLLHSALAEYPHPVPSYVVVAADLLTPDSLAGVRSFDFSLAEKADRLRSELIERLDTLPRQLLHGDPHDGNLLLHDGVVTGFIDVDHLPVGPRIGDLARYLANRMQGAVAVASPEARMPRFRALVTALLDGYASVNPLSAAERTALYPAILQRTLSNAVWCLGHNDRTSTYVTDSIRTAHWIADHLPELTVTA